MPDINFKTTEDGKPWDFIIIGGGPIGLTTAKLASKSGFKAIVLEKGKNCGADIRGETIEPNDGLLNNIWGENFLKDLSIGSCSNNIFISPMAKYTNTVTLQRTPHIFHWDIFINNMIQSINKESCPARIECGNEVKKVILENNIATGININNKNNNSDYIVRGKTIIDCSGHTSNIGRQFDFNYIKINNPILKSRYSNYPKDESLYFKTFFITSDCIKGIEKAPPGMVMIFPNKEYTAEVIYIIFDEYGPDPKKSGDGQKVNQDYLLNLWDYVKNNLPVLSPLMKKMERQYEYFTYIPSKDMFTSDSDKPLYKPGLLFLGDSAGFLMNDTSSGIMTGMEEANWWINAIKKSLGSKDWTEKIMKDLNSQFKKDNLYKSIKSTYDKYMAIKFFGYADYMPAETFNKNWFIIVNSYNSNEIKEALNYNLDEYAKFEPEKQAAVINALANTNFVGCDCQDKITVYTDEAKKADTDADWETFMHELHFDNIFKGLNSSKCIQKFFNTIDTSYFKIFASSYKVQYAIVQNEGCDVIKNNTLKYVDDDALIISTLDQRTRLLSIFLHHTPFITGDQQDMVIEILTVTKNNNGKNAMIQVVNDAGGKNLLYTVVSNKNKQKELDELYS